MMNSSSRKSTKEKSVQSGKKAARPAEKGSNLGALQPTYEALREHFDALAEHDAVSLHRAGKLVNDGIAEPQVQEACEESDSAITKLAKALSIPVRKLYHCRRVAEEYSAEEVQQLVRRGNITWGHLCILTDVSDRHERKTLHAQIEKEKLTTRQLAAEINPDKKPKARGPGRAPAVPKTLRQGLARVSKASDAFVRQVDEAWFCDAFDLAEKLLDCDPKDLPDDVVDQVGEAITSFERIGEKTPKIVTSLQKAKGHVEKALKHPPADAATAPAEDDADDGNDGNDAEPVPAGRSTGEQPDGAHRVKRGKPPASPERVALGECA